MHTTVVTYVEFVVSVCSLSKQLPLLSLVLPLCYVDLLPRCHTGKQLSLALSLSLWLYLPLSLSLSRCSAVPPPLRHSSWRNPGSRTHTAMDRDSPVKSTTSGGSQGGWHDVILTHTDANAHRHTHTHKAVITYRYVHLDLKGTVRL